MTTDDAQTLFAQAVAAQMAGETGRGIDLYDHLLRQEPGFHRAHYNRAIGLAALGRDAEALVSYALALAAKPDYPEAYINFAGLCQQAGLVDKALDLLRLGAAQCPDSAPIHNNLAKSLKDAGDYQASRLAYRRAVALDPNLAPARLGLGAAAFELCLMDEALEAYEAAWKQNPGADPANGIGAALRAKGDLDAAVAWFAKAAELAPENPDAFNNLGLVLRQIGDNAGAQASFRRALDLKPDYVLVRDNHLLGLQYDPATTPDAMLREAKLWPLHSGLPAAPRPAPRDPNPARRLRVGYVSPDFREHACAYFLEPWIAAHDPAETEVFCYADLVRPDGVSDRIKASAHHWRVVNGLGDSDLADLIRRDGIDILVDCAGHTSGNRLGVFARRPAPVQVATLVGYAATTGLGEFDWILADPRLIPPEAEGCFTEPVWRLPSAPAPFRPRESWPEPAPTPPDETVFACVGDPARVDDAALALWDQLLERLPDARLVIIHTLFNDAAVRQRWKDRLKSHSSRIRVEAVPGGWAENMNAYSRFSVAIDTPAHSGGTSVAIPLWMGVPVVALAGPRSWQRMGAAILHAAGLPDLAASSEAEWLETAVALAQDRDRLALLRATLRPTMAASPLCDVTLFRADLAAAFRGMWRHACAGAAS